VVAHALFVRPFADGRQIDVDILAQTAGLSHFSAHSADFHALSAQASATANINFELTLHFHWLIKYLRDANNVRRAADSVDAGSVRHSRRLVVDLKDYAFVPDIACVDCLRLELIQRREDVALFVILPDDGHHLRVILFDELLLLVPVPFRLLNAFVEVVHIIAKR